MKSCVALTVVLWLLPSLPADTAALAHELQVPPSLRKGADVVAEVNGRKISRQEYYNRIERMPVAQQNRQQAEAGLLALGNLIMDELWLQLAEKENVAPTEAQVEERYKEMQKNRAAMAELRRFGVTKEQAKSLLQVQQAQFNLITRGVEVPDKEVRDFYEKNKKTQFTIPENAEVIVLMCEDKSALEKAMDLLEKGVEFETVAQQFLPQGPATATSAQPTRGVFHRGDPNVGADIQKAVFATKQGKYTKPIKDPEGQYVLFKVLRHQKERTRTYSEVKFGIWEGLMQQKGREKRNVVEEFSKFHEKADLKINIDRYREHLVPHAGQVEAEPEEENPVVR